MAAKKKTGLGRGLAELLGEGRSGKAGETAGGRPRSLSIAERSAGGEGDGSAVVGAEGVVGRRGVVEIPVTSIRPNPRQPRRNLDAESLEELARSIESVGVVQPVILRETPAGYELIAGERRWRAAQQAGFTAIPAILREASDVESLEIALVENVVRQQLNPVDEAYAFQVLMDDLGVTQETLAGQIGKSRSTVANKVRLLELPAPVQELLISGALSEGHGRALLGLPSRGEQMKLARKAAEKGLSVRAVEAEVRRLGEKEPDTASGASAPDVVPAELLDSLRDAFFGAVGVMPSVRLQSSGGRVELRFADLAELEQIVTRLSAAVPGRDEV